MKNPILTLILLFIVLTPAFTQNKQYVTGEGDCGYVPVFYSKDCSSPTSFIRGKYMHYDLYNRDTTLFIGSDLLTRNRILLDDRDNYIDLINHTYRSSNLRFRSNLDGNLLEYLSIVNTDGKPLIGIYNQNPTHALDIAGDIYASEGEFENIKLEQSTASAGKILQCTDNNGDAEWTSVSSLGIFSPWETFTYFESKETGIFTTYGRVAINQTNAMHELDVNGTIAGDYIQAVKGTFTDEIVSEGTLTSPNATLEQVTIGDITLNNNTLSFFDNTTEIINIQQNEVFIGVDTDTTNLLVNGTVRAEEVLVVPDVWADYVFADNYQLRSLHELEIFIQQNKHLPGIPDEQTVKSEGVELSKMNAKLLEKVEEMTLYLIEQNKKLQKQGDELKALKEELKALQDEK